MGIARSLADLGNLARDEKDFDGAHDLYQASLRIFQELDHKRGIARLLECFAISAAAQSAPERSLRLAGAAAALRQAIGAPLTLETGLNSKRVSRQPGNRSPMRRERVFGWKAGCCQSGKPWKRR